MYKLVIKHIENISGGVVTESLVGEFANTVGSYILSGRGINTKALISESLESDELSFNLLYNPPDSYDLVDVDEYELVDSEGYFIVLNNVSVDFGIIRRGDPVYLYIDDQLYQKMYVDKVSRQDRIHYELTITSAVGLWISQTFYGGMYASAPPRSDNVDSVLSECLQSTFIRESNGEKEYMTPEGIKYTIATDIAALPVNGHISIGSKRDSLIKILFPYGISLMKNPDGSVSFMFDVPGNPKLVEQERIYSGDSLAEQTGVTDVIVVEHTFFTLENTPFEVLYDTAKQGNTADHLLIQFEEPYYGLDAVPSEGSTFEINESNCNYAVITGAGVLYGKKYTHTRQTYTAKTGIVGAVKEAKVEDQELVSILNSGNTLKRLVNYYANAEELKYSFVQNGEKAGEYITLKTRLDGDINCFVKESELTFSKIIKAASKLVANWIPKYLGNNYNNEEVFTEDGTFTVPEGVESVYLILGGGGQGGQGGQGGSPSRLGIPATSYTAGGEGGEVGSGGHSGKVYTVELTVTEGQEISISVGDGGDGGDGGVGNTLDAEARRGAQGDLGTPTIAIIGDDTYSSESGESLANPYMDILSGIQYAKIGLNGKCAGAKGGRMNPKADGDPITFEGITYRGGHGANAWTSGGGTRYSDSGGGGAAAGSNGGDATTGSGGHAGKGATPTILGDDATVPSSGGDGGNGGGGGGGGLYYYRELTEQWEPSSAGQGGNGSQGGKGASGFALIYY